LRSGIRAAATASTEALGPRCHVDGDTADVPSPSVEPSGGWAGGPALSGWSTNSGAPGAGRYLAPTSRLRGIWGPCGATQRVLGPPPAPSGRPPRSLRWSGCDV